MCDEIEETEDLGNSKCPFCGEENGYVIKDYTGFHERNVLIECCDCEQLYIRVYKFSHIIKLNKETVDTTCNCSEEEKIDNE